MHAVTVELATVQLGTGRFIAGQIATAADVGATPLHAQLSMYAVLLRPKGAFCFWKNIAFHDLTVYFSTHGSTCRHLGCMRLGPMNRCRSDFTFDSITPITIWKYFIQACDWLEYLSFPCITILTREPGQGLAGQRACRFLDPQILATPALPLPTRRLIIVSNVLPIRGKRVSGCWEFEWDEDALVAAAKEGIPEDLDVVYVGQLSVDIEPEAQEEVAAELKQLYNCAPVFINEDLKDKFYKVR